MNLTRGEVTGWPRELDGGGLDGWLPTGVCRDAVLEEYDGWFERKTRGMKGSPFPLFLNVSGIPGAGKSTLAGEIAAGDPSLLYLSFDELMEGLSGYREDARGMGSAAAFGRWERPARWLGYRVLREAVERRFSILFEHSNATPSHVALYRCLKNRGYRVEIRFLEASVPEAIERTRHRERWVPAEVVAERAALLRELNESYKQIVDHFETFQS